jgi:transposase-like protein
MKPLIDPALKCIFKRLHCPFDVILLRVLCYVAYLLSRCHLERMLAERGLSVGRSTVHRCVMKLPPKLEKEAPRRKRTVGKSWRMDETYIKIGQQSKCLYRAVDKAGDTIDFPLCAHRDTAAAQRYFEKSIELNGAPEMVTIDKSGTNLVELQAISARSEQTVKIRQRKYLNNILEQDHRAVKRRTRPMMGFKDFYCAKTMLGGIELMHLIRKGQPQADHKNLTPTEQSYSFAMYGILRKYALYIGAHSYFAGTR